MPGPAELTWVERADFSGGLWQRETERECPENGLLECTDCYPQPRGGIKAYSRWEPLSQNGLPTNALVFQIAKLRPPYPSGRLYLAVLNLEPSAADHHNFEVWTLPVTDPNGVLSDREQLATGTWSRAHQDTNIFAIDPSIQFTVHRTDGAVQTNTPSGGGAGGGAGSTGLGYRVYFNQPAGKTSSTASTVIGSTGYIGNGIWRLGSSAAASTVSTGSMFVWGTSKSVASSASPLWPNDIRSHQARLIMTATFNQLHNRLYFTSQGSDEGTTNFLDPLGGLAGAISFMQPSQSDYMVVAKSQLGIVTVQGDMLNAASRQVNFAHNNIQSFPAVTDAGVAYMAQDDACYIASQQGVQSITPNFSGTPMNPGLYPATFNIANSDSVKLLSPALSGDFLHMGCGYVMDMRTSAWFTSSFVPKGKHYTTDQTYFRTFVAENRLLSEQCLWWNYYLEDDDPSVTGWNPSSEYSFTMPLILNPHQMTAVREVVYHVDNYVPGSKVTLEVYTDKGLIDTKTAELTQVGPQPVRISTNAQGNWVKLRTTMSAPQANPAPNEAPYTERVLIGTQADTRTKRA